MVIGKKLRSCRAVARPHVAISFEGAKPKNLSKKAYLTQRRMEYIYRKNLDIRIYKPKERAREIESSSSMAF